MSDEEGEEMAKQMSVRNPNDVYYIAYDNIMNPCSDKKYYKGKCYTGPVKYKDGKAYCETVEIDKN